MAELARREWMTSSKGLLPEHHDRRTMLHFFIYTPLGANMTTNTARKRGRRGARISSRFEAARNLLTPSTVVIGGWCPHGCIQTNMSTIRARGSTGVDGKIAQGGPQLTDLWWESFIPVGTNSSGRDRPRSPRYGSQRCSSSRSASCIH